jgi:hypothetical protein
MQSINVQQAPATQRNKATPPNPKTVKLSFDYTPSQDGIDLNLLILLHGLGICHQLKFETFDAYQLLNR